MTVQVNGVELFYEQKGQGPDVLLLHGNSEHHGHHAALIERLARHYRVTAPDSRDHGKSGRVEGLSYEDMMRDMAGFIHKLHLKDTLVVGLSDGAIVALLLALHHPRLVRRMVLCGANTEPGAFKKRWLFLIKAGFWATKDQKLELMLTQPHITPEALGRIATPALVLAGSNDMFYDAYTRAMAAALPKARLLVLPGESHDSYIRRPERLCSVMAPFLHGGRPAGGKVRKRR